MRHIIMFLMRRFKGQGFVLCLYGLDSIQGLGLLCYFAVIRLFLVLLMTPMASSLIASLEMP